MADSRFIILCYARTGSELLLRALAQHPQVRLYGELFHAVAGERGEHGVPGRSLGDDEDGATFLRNAVFREQDGASAVGFKLMYSHAAAPPHASVWTALGEDRPVRVIRLRRDDLL